MGGQVATTGEYRAAEEDGPEVTVELGAQIEGGESDPADADHFSSAGDDSPPLPGDWALLVDLESEPAEEQFAVAGYSDDTEKKAAPGERRLYARNPAGEVVSEVFLTGDGTMTLTNTAATVTVAPDGAITLSGTSVSLAQGTALGDFLSTLHANITSWVPVPNDGGAALKAALAPWLAKPPPAP